MKKIFMAGLLCLFWGVSFAFAQQVEVVEVVGKVQYRKDPSSKWENVEKGLYLEKAAEIKVGSSGKCTLAFDQQKANVVTVEKKTQIKIEEIVPGSVFLNKGRVFTLIRNLKQVEKFEIKTPTAVAGARGTGWVTEYNDGLTSVSVFEDNVSVAGLDETGTITSEIEVQQDFQTNIPVGGELQQTEPVPESEKFQWESEVKSLERYMQPFDQGAAEGQKMQPGTQPMMPPGGAVPPEMAGMMKEMAARESEFMKMSPEARAAVMQEMEQRYGMQPPSGAGYYPPGGEGYHPPGGTVYYPPGGEGYYPPGGPGYYPPGGEGHQYPPGTDPSLTGYPPPGGEGYHPPGDYPYSTEFQQYMGEFMGPPPDGMYQEGEYMYYDPYFGEFDQNWSTEEGYYVHDPYDEYYDEYYNTIIDQPPPPPCNNNGSCDGGETFALCPAECGAPSCIYNFVCDPGETHASCPLENCPP